MNQEQKLCFCKRPDKGRVSKELQEMPRQRQCLGASQKPEGAKRKAPGAELCSAVPPHCKHEPSLSDTWCLRGTTFERHAHPQDHNFLQFHLLHSFFLFPEIPNIRLVSSNERLLFMLLFTDMKSMQNLKADLRKHFCALSLEDKVPTPNLKVYCRLPMVLVWLIYPGISYIRKGYRKKGIHSKNKMLDLHSFGDFTEVFLNM